MKSHPASHRILERLFLQAEAADDRMPFTYDADEEGEFEGLPVAQWLFASRAPAGHWFIYPECN
jgi:hypothetical protein